MVKQAIWIGIIIGVFFAGIGVSYAIFASTYDPITMKFRTQDLFEQMMSNNPKMKARWMDSMMMNDPQFMSNQMDTMISDPELRKEMISHMRENQQFMNEMMSNEEMNEMHSEMQLNVNAPITIPLIDGYYNGEKVYFIHTEVSDEKMAEMMTSMINFPTLHVPELKNIPSNDFSKVYVFTNGIRGSEPYGGGPFMFQIDVFDSIPDQEGYHQFRVPHLVTWNENTKPTILTSEDEILAAEKNGELTIQKTENVVNAPIVVWNSGGTQQKSATINRIFESMAGVEGELIHVDVDNYIATFKLHSKKSINKMEMIN